MSADLSSGLCVSQRKQQGQLREWHYVVLILLLAFLIAVVLYWLKPEAEKKVINDVVPLARVIVANAEKMSIPVFSQGTVSARTNIKLVSEVNGKVSQITQLKYKGEFFKQGELLLEIDSIDYKLAITKAEAQVSAAKQQLARVEAEASQARYDLKQIGRDPKNTTAYALREPHLAEAKANLDAAQADLKIAQLQLSRTKITAPFDGRLIDKQVDIGQYVSTGTVLADIYSTESVLIRLPLSLTQIEHLGLGLRNNNKQTLDAINVSIFSEISKQQFSWQANLSHTEAELDAKNRQVYLVAEVIDPFLQKESQQSSDKSKQPLIPGMFVKSELRGIEKEQVIKLPRNVLRNGSQVWLMDAQNKLKIQSVELYAKDRQSIYVKAGLSTGDQVIINNIDFPVTGMSLRLPQPLTEEHSANE